MTNMGHKSSGKKFLSTTALTLGLMALSGPAFAIDDFTTPTGEQVVGGTATFDRPAAGTLNVNQATDRVVINWDSFNIGKQGKTEFFQPGSGSLAVNRVTGADNNPTQILGTLKSNGRVMVLDRNGILFGANAVLDVGGIVASTGDVDNNAVMRGDTALTLTGFGDGSVVNNGLIRVSDAGLAAFVAPHVANNGIIQARMGKVALAAGGESATVDLYGDGLVELAVGGSSGKALAENSGMIDAAGGTVAMSAAAAKGVVDDVINMSGVVKVSSATVKGGKIVLSGGSSGKVKVDGALDASGATGGGSIRVTGENIVAGSNAVLTADATDNGHGGDIYLFADQYAVLNGYASAQGGANGGNGGFVELSARETVGFNGFVSTAATKGSYGTFLIDPRYIVIHSGAINGSNTERRVISATALGNSLAATNVVLQADDFIDVGARDSYAGVLLAGDSLPSLGTGTVDVSSGTIITQTVVGYTAINPNNPGHVTACAGPAAASNQHCMAVTAPTPTLVLGSNNLTLDSNVVNIQRDFILGTGNLTVDAGTLNINGKISGRSTLAGAATLLGDSRLIGSENLHDINVLSASARINQAVAFADSTANKTLNVAAGIYNESVLVHKSNLVLKAAPSEATRITPNSPGFKITAGNVTVDGFVITGASGPDGYGIWIDNAANATIKNNNIQNTTKAGIYATGAAGLALTGNYVNRTGEDAVDVRGSAGTLISGNRIGTLFGLGNIQGDGISLRNSGSAVVHGNTVRNITLNAVRNEGGSAATISGNTVTGGINGILVINSNGAIIGGDDIGDANTMNGSVIGIQIHNSDNATVSGNTLNNSGWDAIQIVNGSDNAQVLGNDINGVSGASGIAVMGGSHNAVLEGNTIDDVARLGIYVWNSNGLNIASNQINNAGLEGGAGWYLSGIHLEGASSTTIEGNTVRNTGGDGIHIGGWGNQYPQATTGNAVRNNTVFATHGDGVSAYDSNGVVIAGNVIGQAGNIGDDGIDVNGSAGAQITGNTVSNVTNNGIEAQSSDDVQIAGNNNISAVGGDGIFVDQSNRAVIGGNTLSTIEGDGVDVRDSRNVDIINNIISGTGNNGVEATNADRLDVIGNGIGLYGAIGGDGIHARGSNNLLVEENTVLNAAGAGIDVRNANGAARLETDEGYFNVVIHDNDIANTAYGEGVRVQNAGASLVNGNQISFTGSDGISVVGNDYARISNNLISFVADNGIAVRNGGEADVTDNLVLFSMKDGISARDTGYANVEDNIVVLSFRNGIHVDGGEEADIRSNLVALSGVDGITVENTGNGWYNEEYSISRYFGPQWNVRISNNDVLLSGRHGISVFDTGPVRIRNNEVALSGTDFTGWIEDLLGGFGYETTSFTEEGPGDIFDYGFTLGWGNGDGIHVEGVSRDGGMIGLESFSDERRGYRARPAVSIVDNDIRWSGGDGIEVRDSGSVRIARNHVEASGINATTFTLGGLLSHFSTIDFGVVMEGFGEAFLGEGSMNDFLAYVLPAPDDVTWGNGDGIHVENIYGDEGFGGFYFEGFDSLRNRDFAVRILNNTVAGAGGDGIEVRDSNWSLVAANTVTASGLYNDWCSFPDVETDFWSDKRSNYGEDDYEDYRIAGNGISVNQMSFPDIFSFNQEGYSYGRQSVSVIAGNAVTDAGENGIRTEGLDAVLLNGNIVRNSGAANLFVAGAHNGDVVLTSNEFIFDNEAEEGREQIGALFESGIIDLTGETNTFTGGTKGMVFSPAETFGFPFPWFPLFGEGGFEGPWSSYAHMELVDNTIGTSSFSGQSQYYIELQNGAFFNPGTPTILDGMNASYDGFTPASVGGFLTQAQFDAIEDKIYHYADLNSLGLFFFGLPPLGNVDQEDIFNKFAGFNPGTGSLTITLTGLPNPGGGAGGNNGGSNGNLASFLASIAPAAGGEQDEQELASIAPAAGNAEEASCWSEAAAQASAGAAVSYTLSGTIETILNQAVACGSGN